MADIAYKGVTLVEQAQPAHVRANSWWVGVDGTVEISLGLNQDAGVYSGYVRVLRTHQVGPRTLSKLPPGIASVTDPVATLDAALADFLARADRAPGQQSAREQAITGLDRAAIATLSARAGVASGRG